MRALRVLACAAVVVVGLGACGGGDDGSSSVKTGAGSTTTPPTTATPGSTTPGSTTPGSATADAFVGLKKQAAIRKAEQEGRPWRIGREDDEFFAVTQDYVENRVTFEIDDGTVTKATFG